MQWQLYVGSVLGVIGVVLLVRLRLRRKRMSFQAYNLRESIVVVCLSSAAALGFWAHVISGGITREEMVYIILLAAPGGVGLVFLVEDLYDWLQDRRYEKNSLRLKRPH